MVGKDVKVLAICAAVVCTLAFALFKELKILCFDSGFAAGLGFSPTILDGLLMLLLVLAVVIGLQSVGVVMMAAMLIIPAAAARLWTDRLSRIVLIGGAVGAISGVTGTLLSLRALRMPTGPLIVLAASATFAISLLIAPKRGLIPRAIRFLRLRARVARENVLRSLYEAVEKQGPWNRAVPIAELAEKRGKNESAIGGVVSALAREGFVAREGSSIHFTHAGLERAHRVVRNYRLWEVFLMYEGQLGVDHVDRDADTIEHYLSEGTVAELERFLEVHGISPKLFPVTVS
jgi:manganese/zinc/iron transport system permease protein